MEAAFAWFGQLIEWFGRFIPRLIIIRTTHAAVKFRRGNEVTPLPAGLHFYWPLITEVKLYPIARQTTQLEPQKVTLKDEITATVAAVITFEIKDIEKIVAHTWDADNTINDAAATAVMKTVVGLDWKDLQEGAIDGTLGLKMRREARKVLDPFGVRVIKMNLTQMAKTTVHDIVLSNTSGAPISI